MDYIWANENDNFSVDTYFTNRPTPDWSTAQRSPASGGGNEGYRIDKIVNYVKKRAED